MAQETEKTSIKGMIQGIAGKGVPEVVQGVVVSADPLKIQAVNDEKLSIGQNIAFVPQHLTDYETEVAIEWETDLPDGHSHKMTGKKKLTVHNALKKGDRVFLLSYNSGKQFFVLGRVV